MSFSYAWVSDNMEINPYDGNNDNQKWLLTHSGVVGYIYIQNVGQGEVLTCSSVESDKVYVSPKKPSLDNNQLWILRDPDSTGNNPCFVITNVITGYALSVAQGGTAAGTVLQSDGRTNAEGQQWSFH